MPTVPTREYGDVAEYPEEYGDVARVVGLAKEEGRSGIVGGCDEGNIGCETVVVVAGALALGVDAAVAVAAAPPRSQGFGGETIVSVVDVIGKESGVRQMKCHRFTCHSHYPAVIIMPVKRSKAPPYGSTTS